MGLENFKDNQVNEKELKDMANFFVDDNISYTKFKAKNDIELKLFLKFYKEALAKKNAPLEEEDQEVRLAA